MTQQEKMMNISECPICRSKCGQENWQETGTCYHCPNCGDFIIESDFMNYIYPYDEEKTSLEPKEDERLYCGMQYFMLQKRPRNLLPFAKEKIIHFVFQKQDPVKDQKTGQIHQFVDREYIESLFPRNFSERVDKTLLNLAALSNYPGENLKKISKRLKHLFFDVQEPNRYSIDGYINLLKELGYLSSEPGKQGICLTAKGWQRVDVLQQQLQVLPQAFIAMWFDDQMEEAKGTLQQAIKACGYNPMIISEKEHNEQIVPEILYEIKRSQFLVADLTGHRHGVYYEAGYAEALGKEVILTCQKELWDGDEDLGFNARHFDVAQQNIIIWENTEDLFKDLKKRIEATVGLRQSEIK